MPEVQETLVRLRSELDDALSAEIQWQGVVGSDEHLEITGDVLRAREALVVFGCDVASRVTAQVVPGVLTITPRRKWASVSSSKRSPEPDGVVSGMSEERLDVAREAIAVAKAPQIAVTMPIALDCAATMAAELLTEVERLRTVLAQLKQNEAVAIAYAGECKADLVRSESKLTEQRTIVAAVRKVVVDRLGDAGAGMDLVTDIDAALGRLVGRTRDLAIVYGRNECGQRFPSQKQQVEAARRVACRNGWADPYPDGVY